MNKLYYEDFNRRQRRLKFEAIMEKIGRTIFWVIFIGLIIFLLGLRVWLKCFM